MPVSTRRAETTVSTPQPRRTGTRSDLSRKQRFSEAMHRRARIVLVSPTVLVLLIIFVAPVALSLGMAFFDFTTAALSSGSFVGFGNFERMFTTDDRFWPAVIRTLLFTVMAVVIQVVLGTAMAIALNERFKPNGLMRTLFLLPMMATPVAISLVWMMMLDPGTGIINKVIRAVGLEGLPWLTSDAMVMPTLAIVDIWQWTPLITLIVLAGLTSVPREPFEAARIDGATAFQQVRYLTLPLVMPYVVTAALFRTMDALKTFDIIYVMTKGGPGTSSETMHVYAYKTGFEYFRLGYSAAQLVFMFTLIVLVSLVLTRLRRAKS